MHSTKTTIRPLRIRQGFTLPEIMIVVVIIGLLAALATPAMMIARDNARCARFVNDLRQARAIFETFSMEQGFYPDDGFPGTVPDGMEEVLRSVKWTAETPIGGQWDWDYQQFGCTAAISVSEPTVSEEFMEKVDARIDDGDLGTGLFRSRDGGYISIIE